MHVTETLFRYHGADGTPLAGFVDDRNAANRPVLLGR
jgi:hypothetical protein